MVWKWCLCPESGDYGNLCAGDRKKDGVFHTLIPLIRCHLQQVLIRVQQESDNWLPDARELHADFMAAQPINNAPISSFLS